MALGTEHIVKAFDADIGRLRGLIAEMGGRAEAALSDAMTALVQKDLDLAAQVVKKDRKIDELEVEIEKLTVQTIALRAPMADDLREVVAALKIVGIIERIGDYAKNIAKRVPLITERSSIKPTALLPSMAQIAAEMVTDVLDAFAARDVDLAAAVCGRDKVAGAVGVGVAGGGRGPIGPCHYRQNRCMCQEQCQSLTAD